MTYDELFEPVARFGGSWLLMIAVSGLIISVAALITLSTKSWTRVPLRVRAARRLLPVAIVGFIGLFVTQLLVSVDVNAQNSAAVEARIEQHYDVEVVEGSVSRFDKKSDTFEVWDGESLRTVNFVNVEEGLVLMDGATLFTPPSE